MDLSRRARERGHIPFPLSPFPLSLSPFHPFKGCQLGVYCPTPGSQNGNPGLGSTMRVQVVVLVLLLATIAAAQDSSQASAHQPASTLSPNQAVITNQDVIGMLRAGLSPEIVAAKIKNSKCQCDTSPAALVELKAAGVPEIVILTMVQLTAPAAQTPLNRPIDIRKA